MKPPRQNVGKAGTKGTKPLPRHPNLSDFKGRSWLDVFPPLLGPFQPGTPPLASARLTVLRAEAAKKKRTPSEGAIGKLPIMLEQGGLDAALWPWIKRWIENPQNKNAGEWRVIPDQRRYLCALVNVAMRPNSQEAKAHRAFTNSVAPNLTRRVLPVLRRRLAKMTLEDYTAMTRNPSPDGAKFSPRSHDKRAKLRAGLKSLPKFLGAP
jgi:hypothetical protein